LAPPTHDGAGLVEEALRVTTKLHADHHKNATQSDRVVGAASRPSFTGLLLVGALCRIGGNMPTLALGFKPSDAPPFARLELAASLAALCATINSCSSGSR
jgi:hypothetical protein